MNSTHQFIFILQFVKFKETKSLFASDWNCIIKTISVLLIELGILANVIVTYPLYMYPVVSQLEKVIFGGSSEDEESEEEEEKEQFENHDGHDNNKMSDLCNNEALYQTNAIDDKEEDLNQNETKSNSSSKNLKSKHAKTVSNTNSNSSKLKICGGDSLALCVRRVILRSAYIGLTAVIGLGMPTVYELQGLIGAFTAMSTCVYIPLSIFLVFYVRFYLKEKNASNSAVNDDETVAITIEDMPVTYGAIKKHIVNSDVTENAVKAEENKPYVKTVMVVVYACIVLFAVSASVGTLVPEIGSYIQVRYAAVPYLEGLLLRK